MSSSSDPAPPDTPPPFTTLVQTSSLSSWPDCSLAGAAGIMSIPTLMAFRDGILVFSQPGALPAAALEQVISAVRGLDMDDVRARLAEQRASAPTG